MALGLLVSLALVPPGVAAAEPELQVLPGRTIGAVTADLDDDGSNEVVRLAHEPSGKAAVDVWALKDGAWVEAGSRELRAGDTTFDPNETPLAGLVGWQVDGRERVLAVSAEITADFEFSPRTCCLEISDVRAAAGDIELLPLAGGPTAADYLQAIDMDGDGTDELLSQMLSFQADGGGNFVLEIYRWTGQGFESVLRREGEAGYGFISGDIDGFPGDELYLTLTPRGDLERLTMVGGEIVGERGHFDLGERFEGYVAGLAADRLVLMHPEGARVARWPRGGDPIEVARLETLIFPDIAVVGDGPDALIVSHDAFAFSPDAGPVTRVFDLDLQLLGEVEPGPGMNTVYEIAGVASSGVTGPWEPIFPYAGPFPGGGPAGGPAYLAGGVLIEPAGTGQFVTRPAGPMIGSHPVGRAGPDGAWMAVLDSFFPGLAGTFLSTYFGPVGQAPDGRLAIVPVDSLLDPDLTTELASVELRGAVELARDGSEVRIAAEADGFAAIIDAPPGSVVLIVNGPATEKVEIVGGPITVNVQPRGPGREGRNQQFDRLLLIMGPDGRAQAMHWEGTFVRVPPELVVNAQTEAFSLRSTVIGRASEGSTVMVDGIPAEFNRFGAFHVEVDAPIWPRDVTIVARDAVGNETVSRLQVVGFFDYRGLPWVPIMGLATVGAAAFLFLRTPRHRTDPSAGWGDATLEEIDAD